MNRLSKRRKTGFIICLITMVMLLCSCSKEKKDSEYLSLLIGKDASSNTIVPINELAVARGYIDKYGLKVKFQPVARSGLFESVALGKLDASTQDVMANLSLGARGGDIVLYGGTMAGGQAVMAYKDFAAVAGDVNNWKGRTVGCLMGGTAEMISKRALLEIYGLNPEKDVHIKLFDSYESLLAGASKGVVDIALMYNSYVDTAKKLGLVYLFPVTDWKEDFVCCRQMAYGKKFRENTEPYKRWLKALILSYKDYRYDEEGTKKLLNKVTGQDEAWLNATIYDKETTQNLSYNPDPNFNGVNEYYDTMIKYGILKSDRPLTDFFNISLYAQALKEVIQEFPDEQIYKDMWTYFRKHNNQYPGFESDYPEKI